MPGIRQILGARGERAAARYLRRRGWAIVARNYRGRAGEIDLVALDGDTIVFVEVKTRRGDGFGAPLEAIDAAKRRQVARVADEFLRQHGLEERDIRFDVVGVTALGWRWRVEHVEDAFEGEGGFRF
jgi:putative endonuclease